MTIRPANGLFGPGPAVVQIQAFASPMLFVEHRVAVTLVGTTGRTPPSAPRPAQLTWR